MRKLIIYYSLSGDTKAVGNAMAKAIDGDVLELKPEKEIKPKGFMKYFLGGKEVIMKEEPKLYPLEKNPNEYEVIFIGTPVWAGNFVPTIRTFLNTVKLTNKKIVLFCCHEGGIGSTFKNIKNYFNESDIIDEKEFIKVSKNKSHNEDLAKEWALRIIKKL